jgi:membrane-associated phospholipid phosphatase
MAAEPNRRTASPSVLLTGAAIAGYALIRRPWANRLDHAGSAAFPLDPGAVLYRRIVEIGSLPFLLGGIALAIVLSIWRDWPRAVACVLGPLAAVITTEQVAKPLVGRHLSEFGGDSYPSGTVTAAAALVTVVTLAVPLLLRPVVGLGGLGVIGAVSVAVVVLGWHYPTDAIGGALVGVGSVLTLDALVHVPRCWIDRRTPAAPPPEVNQRYVASAR